EIANIIGGDELTLTISNEVIARIAVQTCLQSGLSAVYNKLLDFDSVDIYFRLIDRFAERTFREVLGAYELIIPIGIQRLNGLIILNPQPDTKVRKGDKMIILAEDDDELPEPNFEAAIIQEEQVIDTVEQLHNEAKKILLLGWNKQGFTIIRELDHYVEPGSVVTIMAENILTVQKELKDLEPQNNLSMDLIEGDITNRRTLNNFEIHDYSHILILSYSERMPIQEADAHTLVTLMHLRDIKEKKKAQFTIVSEMLDVKNQTLAEVAQPDDFIISDQVISLIISQLAENKELKVVFDELFDSQGAEFYLKPVSLYLKEIVPVNFHTIMGSSLKRNEIAIV
ncbi:MAG: potassium transporter TrkA, partial [Bacteroidota bacterium]